jgi:hypothetical protein
VDKFWELLAQSIIARIVLALMFGITVCYMYASGRPVPENLDRAMFLILGSLFQAAASSTYFSSQAKKVP